MIIQLQSYLKRVLRSSTLAMMSAATFASTATVSLVYPAAAQDIGAIETPVYTPDQESPSWRYRVGLGLALVPDYVGSDDYRFVPLPQLSASKGPQYAALTGGYLSSNVLPSETGGSARRPSTFEAIGAMHRTTGSTIRNVRQTPSCWAPPADTHSPLTA